MKITDNPIVFARKWYDADGIHRQVNQIRCPATGERNEMPKDVYSREFAEWLAEQYRLAMAKGAQLAVQEMSNGIELRDAEIEIRSLKGRCRHLVEILKNIEVDSVFSSLDDTLKKRIYSEIEKDDSE